MARNAEIVIDGQAEFLDLDKLTRAKCDLAAQELELVWSGRYLKVTHADHPVQYATLLSELRSRVDYVRIPATDAPVIP